jgi:midasin
MRVNNINICAWYSCTYLYIYLLAPTHSQVFSEAKGSIGGGSRGQENLQLAFVISDARISQDKERVAMLSREALKRRQLLVLIIIDTPVASQSILNLKSVTYPNGKIQGMHAYVWHVNMHMHIYKYTCLHMLLFFYLFTYTFTVNEYLDSFPFPFYIILQDVNALPAVVSDALRQWFELVQHQ